MKKSEIKIQSLPPDDPGTGEVQEQALDALDTLRSSAFFKEIQNTVRQHLQRGSVADEEKNRIFKMFQGGAKEDDHERHNKHYDNDVDLGTIAKRRHPFLNLILTCCFHLAVFVNLLSSLLESYDEIRAEAQVHAQFISGSFNCLDHVYSGKAIVHVINIMQGGMSIILLYTRTKKVACIFIAFIFVQIVHGVIEFAVIIYRLRMPTVSIFRWQDSLFWCLVREIIQLLIIISGVLMAMQRYYDLASPVAERERRIKAQSYGKRFLNDQIIYKNAPSFLQRKYMLRKATAFQIYSVLQCVSEEAKSRHKRGQTIKFDPIFTKEHVRHAKHDETLNQNFGDDELMHIRGMSALRIHNLEKNRAQRLKDILQNVQPIAPDTNENV